MKKLDKFTTEGKVDTTKPHRVKEGTGADDQEYIDLMGYYKHVARHTMNRQEANEHLDKALKLGRDGDVSKNAKLAGAYI